MSKAAKEPVLVLGGTGYVGGRLIPLLLEKGIKVRAAVRTPEKIKCRSFASHPNLETVQCDVLDYFSLADAARDCRAAYYLVHSMSGKKGDSYAQKDRRAAGNMRQAAEECGLRQIIYLGGLGDESKELSPHLKSRLEVGRVLADGDVALTFLRAAMILGSGSASFEIMRHLVDRLPVMLTPKWVHTQCQPIAISNVLDYLAECLENPFALGKTFDIGGPDILTYAQLFQLYARIAGLRKRLIIPVPLLTPGLSSRWIHLVTPVPASIARPLAEGLSNTVTCQEDEIRKVSSSSLITCAQAISLALDQEKENKTETCWSDAGAIPTPEWLSCSDASYAGKKIMESNHQIELQARPKDIWPVINALGGKNGWLFAGTLWKLRGAADKLLGGYGLNRGRRQTEDLRAGDALDFWRVLEVKKEKRLVLLAEMKLPGEAVLQFDIQEITENKLLLRQISRFVPRELGGLIYWYSFLPFHSWIFKGMLRRIKELAGVPALSNPQKSPRNDQKSCTLR